MPCPSVEGACRAAGSAQPSAGVAALAGAAGAVIGPLPWLICASKISRISCSEKSVRGPHTSHQVTSHSPRPEAGTTRTGRNIWNAGRILDGQHAHTVPPRRERAGAAPRSRLLRSAQTGIPSFHAPIQTGC